MQQRSKFGVTKSPQHHPHHIPQHEQYSEYELGMTTYNNNTVVMTVWTVPPYSPRLMAADQEYDKHHGRHKQVKT
ncbi:hypothetical protein A2U01_0081249 [Trifolium medium]|uniref:Uncharacterized protein n=1 Tax=Trifolium medium TaxID=97028 RepID=A0A392THB3_9FABA|nr:hypothetical protein [Trifolium medium]